MIQRQSKPRVSVWTGDVPKSSRLLGVHLKKQFGRFLRQLHFPMVQLSLGLVSDVQIRQINLQWRKKNEATDVLSFPLHEFKHAPSEKKMAALAQHSPDGRVNLGDIVISMDTAQRHAKLEKRSLNEELERYAAHGLLHLLGYDHQIKTDARKMAATEEALLCREGMVAEVLTVRKDVRRGKNK